MSITLKPLKEQVMVLVGASSGIGLATAEAAAKKKVKLVLAARSIQTLQEIADRLKADGADVIAVACDVCQRDQVEALAARTVEQFGRIDTWVNIAGLGMYGRLDETEDADDRKLFDVNFWGTVYGCRAALPHLKAQGGALINVGSEVSESYVPLLGMYTASKHAVKGFTDALRVEIEDVDKAPVSVTLIQPTAVNTPFPEHARNYLPHEPKLPDPMIEPSKVADAILSAAKKPTRSKRVGTMSVINTTIATLLPAAADRMAANQVANFESEAMPKNPAGALNRSSEDAGTAGRTHGIKA